MNSVAWSKKSWRVVGGIILATVLTGCCCMRGPVETPEVQEHILLDADHTDGWEQLGPGGFTIVDGTAISYGGLGLWMYTKQTFADFTLRLQFKQNNIDVDSGVFVRFPDPQGDTSLPAKTGYQIEIGPVMNGTYSGIGSIDEIMGPIDDVPLKPAGQWNDLEITCIGQDYSVSLNGMLVNTFTGSRALRGLIGLQNHDDHAIIHFRNIRLTEH